MEVTFTDKASGGAFDESYIPELTQLAKENEEELPDRGEILKANNVAEIRKETTQGNSSQG